MKNLINKINSSLGLNLKIDFLISEFEKNPDGAADNYVIETLYTILDPNKFKELMIS